MLSDDLTVSVNLDLTDLLSGVAEAMVHVDLGDVQFDASAILTLVAQAAPPDLASVLELAGSLGGQLAQQVSGPLPGGGLTGDIDGLLSLVRGIGPLLPQLALPGDAPDVGLDALVARSAAFTTAVGTGPLPALFGLLPGLDLAGAVGGIGGVVGGLVEVARALAGLTATSATTRRLEVGAEQLAGRLDVEAARAAGARLGALSADVALVTALRQADPQDPEVVAALSGRVSEFLGAVLDVQRRWSQGMALGEASLIGLDVRGRSVALDLARVTMSGTDVAAVSALAHRVRELAAPLLAVLPPTPDDVAEDVVSQALTLVSGVTATLEEFDPGSLVAPVTGVLGVAVEPLQQVQRAVESVAGTAASAIRALRDLVAQVDLSAVSTAVRQALQPVIDTLDAIQDAVAVAEQVIRDVCTGITDGLEVVVGVVQGAASQVGEALGRARALLEGLHLDELADVLRGELTTVAETLASAQLSPYFDTAIDVIDTGTDVIEAVPFEMLPTDVQQEVVDVAKPIKELDLDPVEQVLHDELEEIRRALDTDVLDAIAQGFAAVVDVLASLDPEPPLAALEAGPLQELRAAVEAVDPRTLLAPAQDALHELSGLLAGVDLRTEILDPLADLFAPVVSALADLDPAAVLRPVQEAIGAARDQLQAALDLDAVTTALTGLRDRCAHWLEQLDPAALVAVLDAEVAARLGEPEANPGPPGGGLGGLLVTLAQASGLDATEEGLADAVAWTRAAGSGPASALGSLAVRSRLQRVAAILTQLSTDLGTLDPAPLTAASGAQHRALRSAVATHPADSPLRLDVEAMLDAVVPATVLGPLAENRSRYAAALRADAALTVTLGASGRSEVDAAAAGLSTAVAPLSGFVTWVQNLLAGLGVRDSHAALPDVLRALYELAGPARVLPAVTALVETGRTKLLATLDALLAPVLETLAAVRAVIDALDVDAVVAEVVQLHHDVTQDVASLSPAALLGPVVLEADELVDRLESFNPLAPVLDAVDAAKQALDAILDAARPTVVFADAIGIHHDVLALAQGLDVVSLVRPVTDALDGLSHQLDDGFTRTVDALQRLQEALPDQVSASSVGGSVSVGVSL